MDFALTSGTIRQDDKNYWPKTGKTIKNQHCSFEIFIQKPVCHVYKRCHFGMEFIIVNVTFFYLCYLPDKLDFAVHALDFVYYVVKLSVLTGDIFFPSMHQ
jgi:hypothetical protein